VPLTADFNRCVKTCANKACQHEGKEQPLTSFCLDSFRVDGLRRICKDCARIKHKERLAKLTPEQRKIRNRKRKDREKRAKSMELQKASQNVVMQLAKKPDVTSVEMLSAQLMHASGGVESFAKKYVNTVDSCEKEGNKIRGYQGIASVVVAASKVSMEANKGPGQMTDEELMQRFNELMALREQYIQQQQSIEVPFTKVESGTA
jgi:hypothetical protein